jgi:oxalate decarboxylase/phosphoglucose isomerase-like protein (cupin superfamily)
MKAVVTLNNKPKVVTRTIRFFRAGDILIYAGTSYMKTSSGGVVALNSGAYLSGQAIRYREFTPASAAEFLITE